MRTEEYSVDLDDDLGEKPKQKRLTPEEKQREIIISKIKEDRYLNSLFRYKLSSTHLEDEPMHQIDNSHTSAMQQSNSTYAGMYSLKNSFVNRKKSKIVVSSGHSTPFKMAGQKTIIPSDPLCEAYSQYVFVPFNTKLADDKQIKHIMLKQIEAENMEKPEIYKADNSPRIESAMATKHSKRAIKLSSSKSSLQGKAKIITAASKTMKKLGKVNENKIRFHKTDAHMTSVDHIDESRDGDFRRLIKTGLSKSFISKQLNSSMHDLAIYKDEVNNRMVRLQRDLSEKIRSSHRMEACLSRYTVKIPKDKVMPPANSENASVDVKGIEEMSIQKNGNRKFGHNMIESEVLSYGCLLHKACFLNVYPMTRSNPVIAVFTVDNPKSSQQENRMMCFGGLGLKLMNDCYYLNLDKMKWIPVVDYSNPQTSSPQFRVGSVHVKFKNSVYIFGGSKLAHSGLITDYWNEALVYELAKDRWSTIKYTYDGGIGRAAPRPSKFSGGSLIKDKVVISGGVNHEGDFIDDYWIFYFDKHIWLKMTVEYEADLAYLSKGFANHTVVGFDNDHQNSLQDHPKRTFDYSVMFGGRNEEGIVKPDLIKAKISRNKAFYQRVTTIGKPPAARYNHSMTYLTKQNILCVFGGQGEDVETSIMADCMNIINMDALQWHSCKIKRKPEIMFESRYCHGAVAFKDNIILFGGINSAGFVDSSIEIIKIEENRTEVSEVLEEVSVILPDPVSIKKLQKNKSKNTAIEHVPIAFEPIRSLPKIADHGRRNLLPIPLDDESLMPYKNNVGSKKTGSKWARIMFRTVTHKVETPQVSPHKGSLKSLNLYD